MVAYPDRGSGNDPEPFFFFFFFFFEGGGGSLSQPRLNIFTMGNMRVMICLGQGGLRSLSASSLTCNHSSVFACTITVYASLMTITVHMMVTSLPTVTGDCRNLVFVAMIALP